MKTVSMGTSEPERAQAARRGAAAAAVTGACLTTSVTRGDSEMRWSRSCTHTHTHGHGVGRGSSGAREKEEEEKTSVCMYCWEELQKRST